MPPEPRFGMTTTKIQGRFLNFAAHLGIPHLLIKEDHILHLHFLGRLPHIYSCTGLDESAKRPHYIVICNIGMQHSLVTEGGPVHVKSPLSLSVFQEEYFTQEETGLGTGHTLRGHLKKLSVIDHDNREVLYLIGSSLPRIPSWSAMLVFFRFLACDLTHRL